MITLKSLLIKEDLRINDLNKLSILTKQFVKLLIKLKVIGSFNRPLTSGQMNPIDFEEEISNHIMEAIKKSIDNSNIRGDKYIQNNIE